MRGFKEEYRIFFVMFVQSLDQKKNAGNRVECQATTSHKISEVNSSSCKIAHNRKSLISIFQEFSSNIDESFILAGSLGTRLSFNEV